MTTIIIIAILALFFVLLALAAVGLCSQLLHTARPLLNHQLTALLARRVVSHLITELHNGEKLDPPTLDHAIDKSAQRLTDLLMMNGYNLRDWNPRFLVSAIIGGTPLLHKLQKALDKNSTTPPCQDSPSTQQSTPTQGSQCTVP